MDQETKFFFSKVAVVLKQLALAQSEVNPSTDAQIAGQDADDFAQQVLRIKPSDEAGR